MFLSRDFAVVPCDIYRPYVPAVGEIVVQEPILKFSNRLMVPVLPIGDPAQMHSFNSHRDPLQTFIFADDANEYLTSLNYVDEGWLIVDKDTNRQYIIKGVDHYYQVGGECFSDPYIHLRLEFVKVKDSKGDDNNAIHP